ncbi:membrane protein [Micromonospora andamanensis]|uniref:Membrane protein n=1 Tax=Micromonospora andamanensis TaxID=1287068 RepID=A0ABQ4I5Y2_9ACTN|nr:membrane protein [Micromonospora andamanensis]GIJ43052.1 membrane protein [Micromonospora andamanensis]
MDTNKSPTVGRGTFYILLAAVAWGTGGAAAAILYDTSGMGPIAVSFWRFAGGVLLLMAGHLVFRRRMVALAPTSAGTQAVATPLRDRWQQVAATGVGLAIYQTAYFASVEYAGLAVATMVTLGSGPILIALGARVTMGERLGRAGTVTVATALVGLVLLLSDGGANASSAPMLGLACALLSAGGYAGVTLLNRKIGQDATSGRPQATVLGGFIIGMMCLLPLALIEGLLPTSGDSRQVLGLLAYLGVVPTAVAYSLFFVGLASVRATTASVIALVEPVTAAVIAVLLLHERLTVVATIGSAVLLSAVVTLILAERRAPAVQHVAAGSQQRPTPTPAN